MGDELGHLPLPRQLVLQFVASLFQNVSFKFFRDVFKMQQIFVCTFFNAVAGDREELELAAYERAVQPAATRCRLVLVARRNHLARELVGHVLQAQKLRR